ncbi:L-ascorbate metabolism protein UlaG, beta-lactamase superfamily [Paenibacillus sp. yr247]|uniref:MBL fold metallo-hydrolase n=1 Tax=Paenibacillus sp. yr247 TaxID=1761880 RepID=UPI000887F0AD|nr:MBL fold metallo-hydrolase [Paenibacillus sp. yr247]SDN43188.1 L-ascorbate metabolism protein UlaG, beta-lactamase superfamily [Paenibacillus sp. yr247]
MKKHDRLEGSGHSLIQEVNNTNVPFGTIGIWFLGQESIILKGAGVTIYIDPFVSDYLERTHGVARLYQTPLTPEEITNVDICLITHEHEDHLDPGTLSVLVKQNESALLIAPAFCRESLLNIGCDPSKIRDADTERSLSLFDSRLKIQAIPAAHEELETNEQGQHRYVGYIVELNGVTIYHAGDTLIYPGLSELLRGHDIDLAMLPINGRDFFRTNRGIVGNMNYREAAELAAEINVDAVIPLHYETFTGNSEHPGNFVDELNEKHPGLKCHVLARGERFVYVSPKAFLE